MTDPRGGSWNPSGEIVFAPNWRGGLEVIPAAGGSRRALTAPELESGERTTLVRANSSMAFVPTGHLLYWRDGALLAQPMDGATVRITGDYVPVAEGVAYAESLI